MFEIVLSFVVWDVILCQFVDNHLHLQKRFRFAYGVPVCEIYCITFHAVAVDPGPDFQKMLGTT